MENKNEIVKRDYLLELKTILESDLSKEDKKMQIMQYHESDIADILDNLEEDKRNELIDILGIENFAEVITYSNEIEDIVEDLEPEMLADIIEEMDVDDAVDILEELDENIRSEVIELIEDKEISEDIINIFSYEEDEIGSEISNNYITININDTVRQAMKKVITEAKDNDNISNIFVLNNDETFYGVIELRSLIIARDGDDLKTIMKVNYPYFYDTDKISDSLAKIKEYGLDSYPVLDEKMNLVGVITHDDALDVTYEEFEEDYARLAGISEEVDLSDSLFKSIKKRLPWLIVLLVLGLIQSFLMTGFEMVVASLPIIVFFQTLVLGMSGNSGTQSLAVTIRTISIGDKVKKQVLKTLLKELRIGFCNGLILSVFAFMFVFLFLKITNQGAVSEFFDLIEALKASGIVGMALLTSMTVSSFLGAVIPMFFKKIHIDPAVASGPFITTINDVTALLIYYGLAGLLFNLFI